MNSQTLITRLSALALALALAFTPSLAQTGLPNYPTGIDDETSLFRAKNLAATTLALALTAGATTATVTDGTKLPSSGALSVDGEIIYYTSNVGNVLSGLTRGREGTVAASHPLNARVSAPQTADMHNVQSKAIGATQAKVGAGASLPPVTAGGTLVSKAGGNTEWQAAPAINCANCTGLDPTISALLLDHGLVEYGPASVPGMELYLDARKLSGAEGSVVTTIPDLTDNENDAVTPNAAHPFLFHLGDHTTGYLPYVGGRDFFGDGSKVTVSLPPSSTKTLFVVARGADPSLFNGAIVRFGANSQISAGPHPDQRWVWYRFASGPSTPAGYFPEWSVLCLRQNGSSVSFFIDGELIQTAESFESLSAYSEFTLGPGGMQMWQTAEFGRALSDAEIVRQTGWFRKHNGLSWKYTYLSPYSAPTSDVPALVTYKEGFVGARPLVIVSHAAGQGERQFHDLATFRVLLTALLDKGYIVAASSMGGDTWGNDTALDANAELYAYVAANFPVDTTKVAMVGNSMGGLATLLAFPDGRIPLKGAALYYPVSDLRAQYDANSAHATAIRNAYGVAADGSDYSTLTAGHDPDLLAASAWSGKRLRFYGSAGDTVVSWTNHGLAFSAKVSGTATEAAAVTLTGDHNAAVETTVADLLAFLGRCFG